MANPPLRLETLPPEILQELKDRLTSSDLVCLALTSTFWYNFILIAAGLSRLDEITPRPAKCSQIQPYGTSPDTYVEQKEERQLLMSRLKNWMSIDYVLCTQGRDKYVFDEPDADWVCTACRSELGAET